MREYIAGWIQKKLSYGNPLLSRAPKSIKTTQSELKTSFVDDVSKGGLTKPDDLLLNMVKNMENEFFKIHGNAFTKQPNIRKNLVSVLKQKYPEIPDDLVSLFARSRIYFRCSFLNKQAEDEAIIARIEKRKKKAEKLKLEIASQLGQQACFEDQKTLSIESVTDANQKSNQSADDDTAMSKICIGPSIGRKNVSKADVETVVDSSKSTCETASKKPTRRQKQNATIKEKINIGNNEPSSSQSKELYSTENQSSAASNVKRRKDRKMKQFLK